MQASPAPAGAFEFATAARIRFGRGCIEALGDIVSGLGKQPLLVAGRNPKRAAPALEQLDAAGFSPAVFHVEGEPDIPAIEAGVAHAREAACDVVVGMGGGSTIDAAKAIAALCTNPGEVMDYLEVVGGGQPLSVHPAPCVAIPTTAGTGAEVTRNAVIGAPEQRVKVSMRHPWMLPNVALVDPALTHGMPPEVTASTGLDALTQLLEAFVTPLSNPFTDGICREGITRAARALPQAFRDGANETARDEMALASLFGGLALANAKLGAVHGFAGPMGGMYPVPHGVVCARLLPHVFAVNVRALEERDPDSAALERFREAACLLTGQPGAAAEDGVAWIQSLCQELQVPALRQYGIGMEDNASIAAKAKNASSMKGNPIALTDEELHEILENALRDPLGRQ